MKIQHSITLLILLLISLNYSNAQNVGIGTNTPNAAAALEINDPNKGLLIPRGETADVSNPVAGLLFYQTSDNGFYYYNGSDWILIGSLDAKLVDGDEDTYITVDNGMDNDSIKFVRNGKTDMAISSNGVQIGDLGDPNPGFNLAVISNMRKAILGLAYGLNATSGVFSADGENAVGIYGDAIGENGIGGKFKVDGINSTALQVENNSIGTNGIVGEFTTNSATNLGILVENFATVGEGVAGRFLSHASEGMAGYFKTEGDNSKTIRVENFSTEPNSVAGSFLSIAPHGYGINVLNSAPTGPGIAGFFSAGSNSGKTLVSTSSGENASAGTFLSTGQNGIGLFANAQGASGIGIEATASGNFAKALNIDIDNTGGRGLDIDCGPNTNSAAFIYHEGSETALQINSKNSNAIYARADQGTSIEALNLGGNSGVGVDTYSQGIGIKARGNILAAEFIGDILLLGNQTMTNVSGGNVKLSLFESGDFGYQFDYNGASDKLFLWSKQFAGNDGIRMTWLKNGNVGIGTTAPAAKLHVNGTVLASCGTLSCSDIRYKRNIQKIENAMDGINQINAVYYDWKNDEFADMGFTNDRQIGIIAQEVEKVYPELVHTNEEGFKTVYYEKLTPILLEGIKEQQKQLSSQQTAIENLQKEMSDLKKLLQK